MPKVHGENLGCTKCRGEATGGVACTGVAGGGGGCRGMMGVVSTGAPAKAGEKDTRVG